VAQIIDVGQILASRKLRFVKSDGSSEEVMLNVGAPTQFNEEGDWHCPYQICSARHSKINAMVGIDSLQALTLTMKTLDVELNYWERKHDGRFYFLDEIGHCCSF
jgi:hypothetical protein